LHVNNQKHGYFVYIWLVAGRIVLCKSGGKFLLFQTSECLTVWAVPLLNRNVNHIEVLGIADNRMVVRFINRVTVARVLVGQYAPMRFSFQYMYWNAI